MILPKPILKALGVETGSTMELVVKQGRIIATPVRIGLRHGWEADAEQVAAEVIDAEATAWLNVGNSGDSELEW